jgi:hypothetical protein
VEELLEFPVKASFSIVAIPVVFLIITVPVEVFMNAPETFPYAAAMGSWCLMFTIGLTSLRALAFYLWRLDAVPRGSAHLSRKKKRV